MIAQIAGCIEEDGQVTSFVSDEDAQFWSVYLGVPGDFKCVEDFEVKGDAVSYAEYLVETGHADILDYRTFSKRD